MINDKIENNLEKRQRRYDYSDNLFIELDEDDMDKLLETNNNGNFKEFRNFKDINEYLEKQFIPEYAKRITKKDKITNEEYSYLSIAFSYILYAGFNKEQLNYVINYLNHKGIVIRGREVGLDNLPNYEHVMTFKNVNNYDDNEINNDKTFNLFMLYKKTNDKKIREQIIINNIAIATSVSRKYSIIYNIDKDELESYAFEGLCKAVDKFNPTTGCIFSTFAYSYVKGFVKRGAVYIKNNYRKNSEYYYKLKPYIQKVEDAKKKKLSDNLHLADDIVDLMINDGVINSSQRYTFKMYMLSNFDIYIDEEEYNVSIDNIYEEILRNKYQNQLKDKIQEILSECLNEKEIFVLTNRFGFNGNSKMTLEKIGEMLGITREGTRQIEKRALSKLKSPKILKILKEFYDVNEKEENNILLYNHKEDDNYYTEDIYDENYDYKKPPRR